MRGQGSFIASPASIVIDVFVFPIFQKKPSKMPKDPAKRLLTQRSWPKTRGMAARKDRASGQVVCMTVLSSRDLSGSRPTFISPKNILGLARQGVFVLFCF